VLRSAEPLAAPIIRAHYLQSEADVTALVHGTRLARQFGAAHAYDDLRLNEIEPGEDVISDGDLARFAREKADTIYHLAGTCRMGPGADAEAVVDDSLCVRGVEGLRVADASIMPEVVNAPTHAACVAIGEKCAALLTGR
jgi:choline dehydrogenase